MRKQFDIKGFTLVEMMVVIAIIAILMTLVITVSGKVIEMARSSQCKNNLKNLYSAAESYGVVNNQTMPRAGCYEWYHGETELYHERRGWIQWQGEGEWPSEDSQFDEMTHPGVMGEMALKGIEEAKFFKYVNKGLDVYCCPSFRKQVNASSSNSVSVYRSYVMSEFFRSAHSGGRYPVYRSRLTRTTFPWRDASSNIPNTESIPDNARSRCGFSPSRLLLFTELALSGSQDVDGSDVVSAKFHALSSNPIGADSVLYAGVKFDSSYDGVSGSQRIPLPPDELYEAIGMIHGSHGNAVFLDGSVKGLTADQTWWVINAHGKDEVKAELR